MTFIEAMRAAKASGNAEQLSGVIPYAGFMGFEIELSGDGLVCAMPFQKHLVGNPMLPALHGGTISALLENAALMALIWETDTAGLPKTINITVEYLRSGRPRDTFAQGLITKLGRRVANVRVEAWQDDRTKPIAAAHGHFLLV